VRAEEFLNLVVTADKMEIQTAVEVLEDETLLQAGARFVETRREAANACTGMKMWTAPIGAHRFDSQPYPAAIGLGKVSKLRDEIGIDLNRQRQPRGRR